MADYISRKAVLALGYWHGEHPDVDCPFPDGVDAVDVSDIEAIPAADAVEVAHGRWASIGIFKKEGPIYPRCSVCGIVSAAYKSQWEGLQGPWKYCPECGAKMDGGNGA